MDTEEEVELPELPKVKRRKAPRGKVRNDGDDSLSAEPRGSASRSRGHASLSPFALAGILTLIFWGVLGVMALLPDLWKWSLVALVPHAFILLIWGMAGVSLVVQEENETHGMICWSSFLLLLTPVIPCVALISLVGLVLILFYGLSRLERTGWYALMIVVAITELTTVGIISTQVSF
ncbi:MAG TPA: hypothetical protein VFG20_00010 [Planctomycetaceae bacterium]|jgi:hypothetical protein|nr:hypothetical protein [Planctomycetaceae bacterium]